MAQARSRTDKFANVLIGECDMSAANTITFNEIDIGLNLFDKVGLLVHRIEYIVHAGTYEDLSGSGDHFQMGLCGTNTLTTMDSYQRSIFDSVDVGIRQLSAAGWNFWKGNPLVTDWSNLPSGGLLIPPKPLYAVADSTGMTVAGEMEFRMFFTIHKLADADYFELLETFRFFE